MTQMKTIILGSESIHRRAVLDELRPELSYRVIKPEIDEKAIRHPHALTLTMRLATAKAEEVVRRVSEPCVIITADQVVTFGGAIREKPVDAGQAYAFLKSYGDVEPVTFVTSVCVTEVVPGVRVSRNLASDTAYALFRPMPDLAIRNAISRGTVLSTAGAIAIEDPDLAPYLKGVWNGTGLEGDARSSVKGLPRLLVLRMLHDYGAI